MILYVTDQSVTEGASSRNAPNLYTDAVEENLTQSPFLDQIDISHLTPEEQANLTSLLMDFSDVFSHENIPMRHTSVVKHSISTTASPIRQLLRRIPQALKSAVSNEVHRMLDHNIIHPSNSP